MTINKVLLAMLQATASIAPTSTSTSTSTSISSAAPPPSSAAPSAAPSAPASAGLSSKSGLALNTGDQDSIKAAAKSVANGLLATYTGNNPGTAGWQIGLFPFSEPFYWWESGGIWGGMLNYWKYTGDTTWQEDTLNAINAQIGPNNDFVMPQEVGNEGNDDQAFWAFTALGALENGFPALPGSSPSYQQIGTNVFNDMATRWGQDAGTCGGGLRWHYTPGQAGYLYKNTVSNGGFFNIAARMAVAANNGTMAEWAEKIWDWSTQIGFIQQDGAVLDGGPLPNCSPITNLQWTYNSGLYLNGAAVMYAYESAAGNTDSANTWLSRAELLLDYAKANFFKGNIMFEAECEDQLTCDIDEFSFKAYLARFMAKSVQSAPPLKSTIQPLLEASAVGAAEGCNSASSPGASTLCGVRWYTGSVSGSTGLGQSLSALEIIQSLLMI